jgi:hypothetical protein
MGGGGIDTSAQDQQIAQEKQGRSDKLKSLEQQRFQIIKSEGAPIWNTIQKKPNEDDQL